MGWGSGGGGATVLVVVVNIHRGGGGGKYDSGGGGYDKGKSFGHNKGGNSQRQNGIKMTYLEPLLVPLE